MIIRTFHRRDAVACRALWMELTEYHRVIYDAPSIGGDDPGVGWDDHLARVGPGNLWVADEGGLVVGLTGLIDDGGEAELEPLIVTKTRRRSGIGRALAEHVIGEAGRRGLTVLSVRPVARNAQALAVFRSLGFTTVGHVELFQAIGTPRRDWIDGAQISGVGFDV